MPVPVPEAFARGVDVGLGLPFGVQFALALALLVGFALLTLHALRGVVRWLTK